MTTIVANTRMAMVFDESQPKYKCCCGCMSVRTGTAIIATLKMFGVLMAILELFTGPHYFANLKQNYEIQTSSAMIKTTTMDPFGIQVQPESNVDESDTNGGAVAVIGSSQSNGESDAFGAVRFVSTAIYLLVEAVAVSCLFYALRRERPKFVIPEMALILICMSLELVVALLVIIAAAVGSESLVQMVVNRVRAQGTEVTSGDVDQIRRLIPFVLTAFAFVLIIGAAIEFWFFRTLKGFYVYLRDKMLFRSVCGDMVEVQHHCYVNGYQPMVEESGINETNQNQPKDMPPAYQDVVKPEEQAATASDPALQPPSYMEFIESAPASASVPASTPTPTPAPAVTGEQK